MVVSEEWVKLAEFAKGVVAHVISLDCGCGFVPVPEEVEILMNTRKVLIVKYVQLKSSHLVVKIHFLHVFMLSQLVLQNITSLHYID